MGLAKHICSCQHWQEVHNKDGKCDIRHCDCVSGNIKKVNKKSEVMNFDEQ